MSAIHITCSELQRLAAEMATEQHKVSGQIQFFADDLAEARDRAQQLEEQLLEAADDTAINNERSNPNPARADNVLRRRGTASHHHLSGR